MAEHEPEASWRQWVRDRSTLPRNEATTEPAAGGFTPATGFGPVTFQSNRPDDPAALLDGLPLVKFTAIKQRALDLHGSIPTFETIRELQLEKISHANRISELMKPRGDGGPNLPESAPQVATVRKQMQRAEQEFERLQALREIRTSRWNSAGQLERSISDWLLRGGIPHGCVIESIDDPPVAELLKKGESIANAVERYRHRLRELAADAHRVRSAPWPSSLAKATAKAQIEMLADAAAPDVDRCVEHNLPVGFMTTRLTALVHNVDARGAVAQSEMVDVFGTLCWLLRDQLLAKINAAIDEAADDKHALDEKTRAEKEAQINADMLMTERNECACIWHAEAAKGEILDFRNDTLPVCAIGVQLKTLPRAAPPGTSVGHAWDVVGPGLRK